MEALHFEWSSISFFFWWIFHHDNLKTAATWKMAINAFLLICLVIIFCAKGVKCCHWVLCVAAVPFFRRNNLSPLLNTKATLGARLLVPWWPASFSFFSGCSFREKHVISKLDVFDWEGKRLGLWRKSIKRRESAVILSIKGRLTGWVMSGNHLSERDRLTQALFDLAVWTTHTENRKWSSFPGISRVLQLGAMLMAFLALTFSFSVFLFYLRTYLKASVSTILWWSKIKIFQSSGLLYFWGGTCSYHAWPWC